VSACSDGAPPGLTQLNSKVYPWTSPPAYILRSTAQDSTSNPAPAV
jgi:hypothetical protein